MKTATQTVKENHYMEMLFRKNADVICKEFYSETDRLILSIAKKAYEKGFNDALEAVKKNKDGTV